MSDIKAKFIGHTVRSMTDPYLKEMAIELLETAPDPFWIAPASSGGKHHPPFARGEGGLVRHTVAVMHIAGDLCRPFDLTGLDLDIVMLASAVHDTYKGGKDSMSWGHTTKDHADVAALKVFEKRSYSRSIEQQNSLIQVGWAVRNHMSMWGVHPLPLRKMDAHIRPHAMVVSAADYIASRQYLEPVDELADLLVQFTSVEEDPS